MPQAAVAAQGIDAFLVKLADCCPALSAVWMIGCAPGSDLTSPRGPFAWELVAFADAMSLQHLRKAAHLHRGDMRLRVVTDGDRFDTAWGEAEPGALSHWGWRQCAPKEAFYSEACWRGPVENRDVERIRRKAVRLWQPAAARPAGGWRLH